MGTAELLAALRSEGKRKEEAIRRRAGEEAARLREEAALGLARLREMHLQEQERLIAAQERAILAEAERAARRVRLVAEEEMASRFHDLARRLLPRLRDGDYPAAFARLAAELPPLAWETVRVNPADGKRAAVLFPGARIETDPAISGGMEAITEGGRMRVVNTLEKRLARGWPDILPHLLAEAATDA